MFKFYSLKKGNFQSQLKTLFFIIGILIIESYPAFSIDITHYISNFSEITGMFESQEHGLVYSNSLGVFKLNKITGEIIEIGFYPPSYSYFRIHTFFEFNGDLYFYTPHGQLFKLYKDKGLLVLNNIFCHYIKEDKLYIISDNEPCLKVLTKTGIKEFFIGENNNKISQANLIELKGEIYGYLSMFWSGTKLIFKFTENGVTPIMSQTHQHYNEFCDLFPNMICNVNDELWVTTYEGVYKFSGNDYQKIDSSFIFRDEYFRYFNYENGIIYYSNHKGIFKFDIMTKEKTELYLFDATDYHLMVKGKNSIYYIFNNKVYRLNLQNNNYEEIFNIKSGKILVFTEGLDEKIFVAKQNQIEWYNNFQPKIFGENGIFTNRFYGIIYDEKRNLIAALGLSSDDFLIQRFDGQIWDTINVPYSNYNSAIKANIVSDLEGNYFVTSEDFLGKWDGKKWERISLLKNPDIPDVTQKEYYNVLFRDSTGGVWFGVYLDEYDENTKKNVRGNSLWRYFDGSFIKISKINRAETVNSITKGFCLKDGTCIIDISEKYLFKYVNNEFSYISISDGDEEPETNNYRNLCVNSKIQVVLTFVDIEGWSSNSGTYFMEKGISVYNNETWEHNYYKNIAKANDFDINGSFLTTDTYGNEWLLGYKHFLRINSNGTVNSFPIATNPIGFSPGSFRILQTGNLIWYASYNDGLFTFTLPEPTGVNDNPESSNDYYLINEVVENNILELSAQPDIYSIISVLGEKIAEGKNKRLIDISSLNSGVYFIISENSGKKQINKFIKID